MAALDRLSDPLDPPQAGVPGRADVSQLGDRAGKLGLVHLVPPLPSGAGTLVRLTESGFREKEWEVAVLEAAYADHVNGWDILVPSLRDYVTRLVSAS